MPAATPHERPFRFSVQCSSLPGVTGPAWAELARTVEDLGYSTLTIADHLDDQLATVPALMAAADATSMLRVGALVFCNDYKHPVVLAKEAATIDLLSGGRLELGLGAGWMTSDYERSGIALDPASARIARLAEGIAVVKGLMADAPLTFAGDHYRVTRLDGLPKPVQRPHPPILVGGGGRKILTLAGQEADIVGLNVSLAKGVIDADAGPNATVDATLEKVGWVREAAGDRWADIELQIRVHLALVTNDRAGAAELLAAGFGLTPEQARVTPHALCGSVEQIADDLVERRERFGISAIGLSVDALHDVAPVVARLAGT
jgi:probable F420-dependent oxidoreductase